MGHRRLAAPGTRPPERLAPDTFGLHVDEALDRRPPRKSDIGKRGKYRVPVAVARSRLARARSDPATDDPRRLRRATAAPLRAVQANRPPLRPPAASGASAGSGNGGPSLSSRPHVVRTGRRPPPVPSCRQGDGHHAAVAKHQADRRSSRSWKSRAAPKDLAERWGVLRSLRLTTAGSGAAPKPGRIRRAAGTPALTSARQREHDRPDPRRTPRGIRQSQSLTR